MSTALVRVAHRSCCQAATAMDGLAALTATDGSTTVLRSLPGTGSTHDPNGLGPATVTSGPVVCAAALAAAATASATTTPDKSPVNGCRKRILSLLSAMEECLPTADPTGCRLRAPNEPLPEAAVSCRLESRFRRQVSAFDGVFPVTRG